MQAVELVNSPEMVLSGACRVLQSCLPWDCYLSEASTRGSVAVNIQYFTLPCTVAVALQQTVVLFLQVHNSMR